MNPRDRYVATAVLLIGKPYLYGQPETIEDMAVSDIPGCDCSGAQQYALCHAGMVFDQRRNAHELAEYYASKTIRASEALPGCLFFYGDSPESISHVMGVFSRDDTGLITLWGARGGTSETITVADAIRDHAVVAKEPFDYWASHRQFVVDPFC
jgi:hypothetical protein